MIVKPSFLFILASLVLAGGIVSCASSQPASTAVAATTVAADTATNAAVTGAAVADETAPFPPGAEGKLIAYGHDIVTKTPQLMGPYVRAGMSCEACHNGAGRKPHAGSFLGIYAKFPQWNKRSHRFITVQDRLAECFLYSMNGRPPAYDSREMVALTAYIAFVSRGAKVGEGFKGQKLLAIVPQHAPSIASGAKIYGQKCAACHAADGNGNNGAFPPLWGAKSFNNGAGMHRLNTMASFVRYNMPYGGPPNVLSAQESYDVSAYVLSHARPAFVGSQTIAFPPQPASHF
jgi:thiosulfate dehydrogenase